jgi:hypothetical protein
VSTRLLAKHIDLVEAVNSALTEAAHSDARLRLEGFREAVDIVGERHLIALDNHYLDQGIDRPMCCGVWLDWEPIKKEIDRIFPK